MDGPVKTLRSIGLAGDKPQPHEGGGIAPANCASVRMMYDHEA